MKCPLPATIVGIAAVVALVPVIAMAKPSAPAPAPAIVGPAAGAAIPVAPAYLLVAPSGLEANWRLSGPRELAGTGASVRFPDDLPAGRYRLTGWASDAAGTPTDAVTREFSIDPDLGAGPAITAAPDRLTNDSTPEFGWTADLTRPYGWDIAGEDGSGPKGNGLGLSQVAIDKPLADGAYAFSVSARGEKNSAGSTVIFEIDATAPEPPKILDAAAGTGLALRFRAAEPGGTFAFQVLSPKGEVVAGPEPLAGTAQIGGLRPGSYDVQIRHTDAAGNASRWSRSVRVTVPVAGGEPTSAAGGGDATATPKGASFKDQLHHTRKLSPRAGAVVRTRTPKLSWRGLPKGTTAVNLQVFRLVEREGVWRWTRVFSDDVTAKSRRVPPGRLTNGIYAWRIWPKLRSGAFTETSLAISYFVVKAPRRGR